MNNLIAKRSQIIEAQFAGLNIIAGRKYPFTQEPNLSNKRIMIYGFEAYTYDDLQLSPSNNVVLSANASKDIVITFVDENNTERIYQIPYTCLIASSNLGFIRMVKPFTIDLTKSYVQCSDSSNLSNGEVACLNLYYSFIGE